MTSHVQAPDRWIFIGFLLLIAWLPLPLGSNRVWAWSIMEIWTFLLTILWLVAYLAGRVEMTPAFRAARFVIILFILWLCWIGFQIIPLPKEIVAFVSPNAAHAYALLPGEEKQFIPLTLHVHATKSGLLKSLAYILIFCLTLLLVNRRKRIVFLAYTLILSATFQAVYGSLMTLSGIEYGFFIPKESGKGLATGTFVNPNHLAGYLGLGLAMGIGLLIAKLDTGKGYTLKQFIRNMLKVIIGEKMRLRLFLVFMVIALVLTHSRMGNTAFFSAILIAGTIGLVCSKHATRSTVILLASLIIIDLMIIGSWFGVEKISKEVQEVKLVKEDRDEVFEYIIDYWQDYKVTGSGLGSFHSVFPRYRQKDVDGYYSHAHNDYLQFMAETGVIGFTLLALSVMISFGVALIAQFKRHDQLLRGMSFTAIMGIITMLIHVSVEFNLQIPANAATFMILLALAWIAYSLKIKHH